MGAKAEDYRPIQPPRPRVFEANRMGGRLPCLVQGCNIVFPRKPLLTVLQDNVSGRVNAVYSGSSLHYIQAIKTPRYEDFEIEYQNEINP